MHKALTKILVQKIATDKCLRNFTSLSNSDIAGKIIYDVVTLRFPKMGLRTHSHVVTLRFPKMGLSAHSLSPDY